VTLLQRWTSLAREALVPSDSDLRDRLAFLMLLAFILLAPWLQGASLPAAVAGAPAPVGRLLIPAFGFAIGALTFSSRSSFRSLRPLFLTLASILAVALLGLLQLIPLPEPTLAQIASVNLQIYHETAELFSLYGQTAPSPRISLAPEQTAATVLLLGGCAVLLAATPQLLRTRLRRRAFAGAAVLSGCLQIAVAGALAAKRGAFRGIFESTAELGSFLLVLLPVAFGSFWAEVLTNSDRGRDTADRGERLAVRLAPLVARLLGLGIIGAGIVLTGSPVRMTAAGLSILLLWLLAGRHSLRARRPASSIAAGLVAWIALGGRADAQIPAAVSAAAERTLSIWQTALEAWQSFPIFGAGLGAFSDAFRRFQPRELGGLVESAMSLPLQLLVTGGAVGAFFALLASVSMLVLLLRRFLGQRHREESALTLVGIGALLAVGLDGLAEFNLAAESVPAALACVLGLALAAGDGSRREQTWSTRTP
jgi:O-Antigen ligase